MKKASLIRDITNNKALHWITCLTICLAGHQALCVYQNKHMMRIKADYVQRKAKYQPHRYTLKAMLTFIKQSQLNHGSIDQLKWDQRKHSLSIKGQCKRILDLMQWVQQWPQDLQQRYQIQQWQHPNFLIILKTAQHDPT